MSRNYSSTAIDTTLTNGVSPTNTAIEVGATTGFPAAPFMLALSAGTASQELVLVTNVGGLTLTVTRGYDSTVATTHDAGAVVRHSHAAIDFREAGTTKDNYDAHAAATDAHGATGAVVGTTNTQTLTNKTLTAPIVNGKVLGAWEAYTPSISNFGGTVDEARFCVIGNMCFIHVHITLTAVPTNTMIVGAFPRAAVNYSGGSTFHPLGTAIAHDVGTNAFTGIARLNGTTSVAFRTSGTAEWSATTPHTWANGDKLSFSIAYEI